MMIHIVFWVEGGQRQPRECRRKSLTLDRLPKCLGPLDVVVAVEVAATDRRSRELELPENHPDRDRAGDELNDSYG